MSVFFVKAYIALIQEQNTLYGLKNITPAGQDRKILQFLFSAGFFRKISRIYKS